MSSLKKRVSNYFRQLSFHNESRERRSINENSFVTRYLEGGAALRGGPQIYSGKNPTDLPNLELEHYEWGYDSIIGCYTGPDGGLTTIKRTEKHLSVLEKEIDFIDTAEEELVEVVSSSTHVKRSKGQPVDNSTMVIKVAGQEYCVTNRAKMHSKSHSLGSMSDFHMEVEKTRIDTEFITGNHSKNDNQAISTSSKRTASHDSLLNKSEAEGESRLIDVHKDTKEGKPQVEGHSRAKKDIMLPETHRRTSTSDKPDMPFTTAKPSIQKTVSKRASQQRSTGVVKSTGPVTHQKVPEVAKSSSNVTNRNYLLSKSRSDSNAFHGKRGKIIKVSERPQIKDGNHQESQTRETYSIDESKLPVEWNRKTDTIYGVSGSLYDRNQVTKIKNGTPIADCFGIIARRDSAILAVADGVNWGEKACLAAKSAVHGCLYYLNKTLFNDTKIFDNLTSRNGNGNLESKQTISNLVTNTRDVFVSLLRAFTCAHDLILENDGMLTTLTVAVVLPLKKSRSDMTGKDPYVCCVCNVGDTLAYVYSLEYGMREITKGSHDITSNRDMRDALGALGPVDGVNPELSNLTISLTKLHKGDIVMVASDGLTDNFDPNVCRFSTNSSSFQSKFDRNAPSKMTKDRSSDKKPPSKSVQISGASQKSKETSRPKLEGSMKGLPQSEAKKDNVQQDTKSELHQNVKHASKPTSSDIVIEENPLVQQFLKDNALDPQTNSSRQGSSQGHVPHNSSSQNYKLNKSSSYCKPDTHRSVITEAGNHKKNEKNAGYKFMRSKTSVDLPSRHKKQVLRDPDGLPFVTPIQRYELQLLLIEEILKSGISGKDASCTTAKKLCENLVNFTFSITAAKRHSLEDSALYFDNNNGLLVEVSSPEKKIRRKKAMEKLQSLPGKLDHVTLVAYNVGNTALQI